MVVDMEFDGQVLTWNGSGRFKATSGLPDNQVPKDQCVKDKGPVPEGVYKVLFTDRGAAQDDGTGKCALIPGWGVQTIPRGAQAGSCEKYWANWGRNRAMMIAADPATRNACATERSGFYLHDSTKGYSHGCIEVETSFFAALQSRAKSSRSRNYFILKVKYVGNRVTNGGTLE
ncbi:tlde1 domain-containing protein [Massilia aquatica]|uniref:DUF2778 domain-containing protein n=1 Tax=Massilia aquatica TaxID=2609000 RepID=A0ABX0M7H2_9BURK|nr:tlde1 domain-containing protein [Massilia aquatica]NHZ42533.1 DUF2778 domain-containing protein [Massilia aquatica]